MSVSGAPEPALDPADVLPESAVPRWVVDPVAWEAPRPGDPDFDEAWGRGLAGDPAEEARVAARVAAWPPAGLLDGTGPGPELASLLAEVDADRADADQLIAAAAAAARLAAWATGREAAVTAALVERVAGWPGVDPPALCAKSSRAITPERMAASELGPALALSPRGAQTRVEFAVALRRLPATRAALSSGTIDWAKAKMLVEQTATLGDQAAAAVEAKVLARAGGRTYSELRQSVRRAVLAADPAASEDRRQQAIADRRVERCPLRDGMAALTWTASAERIEAFYVWLTAQARQIKATGDQRSLDQIRSDILADIGADGLAYDRLPTEQGRAPQIGVLVALPTLMGLDDEPGELRGHGPIPASVARRIAADGAWRRILTEPRTGRFDEMSTDSYQIPQDLRDHVLARDRTCRWPGCRAPAARCDLDHHIPHPRGQTCPANLGPLCRAHHQVKTHTRTTIDPDGNGGLWITLPSGRTYHQPAEPALDHPWLVNNNGDDHSNRAVNDNIERQAQIASPDDDIPPF